MEHRQLGTSGPEVSAMGLGTNNFGRKLDETGARRVLNAALDAGITFIDTADVYGMGASETLLGRLLGPKRNDVLIATKFGFPMGDDPGHRGASRRWIVQAVEDSLRRLATDHIDLYQLHGPDAATPIEETLRALDDLVSGGKVRWIGHSNFHGWQVADAQWTARVNGLHRPVSEQGHYNLLRREVEADVLPACRAFGLGFIPYYPLASGFLTGKYGREARPADGRLTGTPREGELLTASNFDLLDRLGQFAADAGHSLLELSIGFLLSNDAVSTVIASAGNADQVRGNVSAAGWRLSADERAALHAVLRGGPGSH
jgi:aryl-alcohol dehydrogenase-like predicted oxidoreductase